MNEKEVTFLSTRGRGLGIDQALLKSYLSEYRAQQLSFRFYLNNEMIKNPVAAYGYRRAKRVLSGNDKRHLSGCVSDFEYEKLSRRGKAHFAIRAV